jgi:cell division septation protein DedD
MRLKTNYGFEEFEISDFDFFVYRAHVLSSEDNANNLKEKVVNGGFPAFVESFWREKKFICSLCWTFFIRR